MNAVYMLWVRQFKCCARFLPRVIASLGQPLLYPLAMGFRFGPIFKI
jgi:ABC-2 type transport system permease protein